MINSIISGISNALFEVFGYENYKNKIPQDLNPPCFYISCMDPAVKKYIGTRYLRKNHFAIQFFPGTDDPMGQCYEVGEKMFYCLEVIKVEDFSLRGMQMRFEIVDNVLHFFVDYDAFVRKVVRKQDAMETMQGKVQVKE